jgi:undecaprenyl-diphosphatase
VFEAATYAGTYGGVWLALALALALVSGRRFVLLWTLAAVGAGEISSDALKAAIPRARPQLDALVARPHTHSFPSGHAAISFACATVLGAAAPRLRVPLYLLAALIAWSRAYVGVHYPLDVLAGAGLGTALGFALLAAVPRVGATRWRASVPSPPVRVLRSRGAARRRSRRARRRG